MKKLVFLLLALVLGTGVYAGSNVLGTGDYAGSNPVDGVRMRNITMYDGLPANGVRSVLQDRYGFIWLGTDNGLCRYDGHRVQTFYNPHTRFQQFVSSLYDAGTSLLVGGTNGVYEFDFRTESFTLLTPQIKGSVSCITADKEGNVWVGTHKNGIFRYDRNTRTATRYYMNAWKGSVGCILVDDENQVWATTLKTHTPPYWLNRHTNRFEAVSLRGDMDYLCSMSMVQMADGKILVGTWEDGLVVMEPDGNTQRILQPSITSTIFHIHKLYMVSPYQVLVGSDDGLLSYDFQLKTCKMLSGGNSSSTERFVYGIEKDTEGGMWISTFYGGVIYVSPAGERFLNLTERMGLRGNVVEAFAEDAQHRIWIATDDGGLSCYDAPNHRFVDYPGKAVMGRCNVHALHLEGNNLWAATYGDGVVRLSINSGSVQRFTLGDGISSNNSFSVFGDSRHRLWATSMSGGVYRWNQDKNDFELVFRLKPYVISDIQEDGKGNLWFASQGDGLWRLDAKGYGKEENKAFWKHYLHRENDEKTLPDNRINHLGINPQGQIFVATDEGVAAYQAGTDCFQRIPLDVSPKSITCILFNQGEIWMSTDKGILRCTPGERTLLYDRNDGLVSEQFLPSSGMMASDGRIYLGTTRGVCCFYPYQVKINKVKPSVFITSLELYNRHVEVGSDKLPEALSSIPQLDIAYGEDMFSLSFASLSYISPEKNQYAYRMDGFDKDWIYCGSEHKATYTNLSAGTYTFRVKATNNDGVWSKEAVLKIVVHPPFWWSWPAKLFYLLLIGGLIYLYTQMRLRKEKRRHQLEIEGINEKKEQEVREARLKFFTMIAHEIRTPVSLIIGPLENLKAEWKRMSDGVKASAKMDATLDVIDRNAQRLLDLINQLLDFNKVQQAGGQMRFKLQNMAKLMAAVAERFEPTLAQRGVKLEVEYPAADFVAMVDGEALTKVISNLMSNASKYTRHWVRFSCQVVDAENFRIRVADDGEGISQEEQQKIFAAFYQAKDNKPGTGIGLSIVKSLVEAHHGMVEVESEVGKGTCFVVTLPVKQQEMAIGMEDEVMDSEMGAGMDSEKNSEMDSEMASEMDSEMASEMDSEMASEMAEVSDAKKTKRRANSSLPTMLVVEDDADMRQFIASNFSESYEVFTAENGVEALEVLKQHQITLIVSDWMMPEMDGAQLCKAVRQNQETCHVPFIMLTAKTDNDSKAESMDCGADAYIEKPFSMKYLEACIRNLIEMRRLLQSKYSHTPLAPITQVTTNKMDNAFLVKMNEVIEANLNNPCMSVVFLAEQMNMSRSALFLKVRALVDLTPNEMIQLVRLKRAAALLKEGSYRVNEVCYMVGFSSPSYFSKCFQKQFGMKPFEFQEMQ